MEILQKALNEMPDKFTSNQFIKVALKYGISEKLIRYNGIPKFLRKHVKKTGLRLWEKKQVTQRNILHSPFMTIDQIWSEESSIQFLKSKGYKIMKPTTGWEEI